MERRISYLSKYNYIYQNHEYKISLSMIIIQFLQCWVKVYDQIPYNKMISNVIILKHLGLFLFLEGRPLKTSHLRVALA
jgi:hypothetical protein